MNSQFKILAALMMGMMTSVAYADNSIQKTATPIDFNKMINEGTADQEQLHNKLEPSQTDDDAAVSADKAKVMDLVDEEINMGESRPVVDRRFNSVGNPKPMDQATFKAMVKAQEDLKPATEQPGS